MKTKLGQEDGQKVQQRIARKSARPADNRLADNQSTELLADQVEEEEQKLDIAERTRQRLAKYNILQLRTVNHYMLRRVKIPIAYLAMNLRLQPGHIEVLRANE